MNLKVKKIIFPFVGDSIGGSQISTIELIKILKKKKFKVDVFVHTDGPLYDYLKVHDIKCINLKLLPKNFHNPISLFLNIIKCAFKNKNLINKKFVKYIYTNDIRMHYFWSLLSFIFGYQHIWHQHSAFYSRRNIFFSKLSSQIFTISNFCKFSFTKEMSKRALVLPNFFNLELIKKIRNTNKIKLFQKYNLNPKKIYVTYVGNINKQKRFNLFLKIALKLKKKYDSKIFFLVIGKDLENLVSQKDNNFIFFNFNYNVLELIRLSNLVISTSINEGFGRVIVESSLLKVPILASNSGAHKELIKNNENGILAKSDSTDDFFNKALQVLSKKNSRKIKKMVDTAYNFFSKNYSNQRYNKIINEIF